MALCNWIKGVSCDKLNYLNTVKPVYNGQSMEKQKVAVVGR